VLWHAFSCDLFLNRDKTDTGTNQTGFLGRVDLPTSKLIADRCAILRTVRTALHVHAPEIVVDLEKLLFPVGTPQNLTVQGFLTALEDRLTRYGDALIAVDETHSAEEEIRQACRTNPRMAERVSNRRSLALVGA
jgi:hypothetical protein